MFITKDFQLTESGLERLRKLSSEDLMTWINEKNFFAGLSTEYANQQNKIIYEKIYVGGTDTRTGETKQTRNRKGNKGNNTKR